MKTLASPLLALACLATPLRADVFVVDDDGGPGVHFTDLPPAILAAGHGDTLDVRPGTYSHFSLDKALRVIGTGNVVVAGPSQIAGIDAGRLVVLADLELASLRVTSSSGTIVLDSLQFLGAHAGARIAVDASDDVRIFGCMVVGSTERIALAVTGSRVEVVQSMLRGGAGFEGQCAQGGDGAAGLRVTDSRVQAALTSVLGGAGGDNFATCSSICGIPGAGDGGPGLATFGASAQVFVAGRPSDVVKGGFAGIGELCPCDGYPGDGAVLNGDWMRYSGTTVEAGDGLCTSASAIVGAGATNAVPPDVTLERIGVPLAGGSLNLRVRGAPGANARLYFGKGPVVNGGANPMVIEQLTSQTRAKPLEVIPPSGFIDVRLVLPPNVQPGLTYFCQATAVQLSTQAFQRSNSVPIVIR